MQSDHLPPSPLTAERFRSLAVDELDAVYRFAFHLSRSSAAAEDLTQQTYLNAFQAWRTFRQDAPSIRPWLFKILHNVYRASARRSRPMSDPKLSGGSHCELEAKDVSSAAAGSKIDWEHVDDRLRRAVLGLGDELREAFLLFSLEDFKYREIADILQIPIGTVMSRLSRARTLILKELRTDGDDERNNSGSSRIVRRENS